MSEEGWTTFTLFDVLNDPVFVGKIARIDGLKFIIKDFDHQCNARRACRRGGQNGQNGDGRKQKKENRRKK